MSFEQWVRDNWPVKLDIVKGNFSGDPNSDESVSNYSVVPALLFDTYDRSYYLNFPDEWKSLGSLEGGDDSDDDESNGDLSFEELKNSLEEGEGISLYTSYGNKGEAEKIRLESDGLLKAISSSSALTSLFDAFEDIEGVLSKSFPATDHETTKVRLNESGNVKASPSDKGASDLFNKLETGNGLALYRQKDDRDEEKLELSLDNRTQEIIDNLKYKEYIKRTEQRRNLDIYVDCKTAPYKSLRDGSKDRPYLTIKEAVESEQAQENQCTIWVLSGIYIEDAPITLPPSTSVIGSELRRVRVYPSTDTCGATYDRNGGGTYLFEVTYNCILRNMTLRGIVSPGFVLGYVKDANLRTISPYIQNMTSYNDGRDVHQLFERELTRLSPQFLPNKTDFKENIKLHEEDGEDVIYIDREKEKTLQLAKGETYSFEISNGDSQLLRFTENLEGDYEISSLAEEDGVTSYLDLTEYQNQTLYYVLYPDAIGSETEEISYGKVEVVDPDKFEDDYVIREGDKVEYLDVDPLPLNLERGDAIYVGDPGEFPVAQLKQQLRPETFYSEIEISSLKEDFSDGDTLYVDNGDGGIYKLVLSESASEGDKSLKFEESMTGRYGFSQGATIHKQHPTFTERFILRDDAPKGTTRLYFSTNHLVAESYAIAYELEDETFEEPPNDELELIESLSDGIKEGEELWLLETENDLETTNNFPVKVKSEAEGGAEILQVTDAYIKPSSRDKTKIRRLNPQRGESAKEDEKPVSSSYIRSNSIIRKDPFQRRNGGGGAHVDGFRLRPETRLSENPPDSRLMCFNDFTQVNLNGYGILCEGIANAECVSVFTYFTNNGLYARNGGEIRALNCSSGFGVYGVKAEGYLGQNPEKSDENTPEITAEKIWIGYDYSEDLESTDSDPEEADGELLTQVAVLENPTFHPTKQDTDADPTIGSLIRVNNGDVAGIVDVKRYEVSSGKVYIKIRIAGDWTAIGANTPSEIEPFGDLDSSDNDDGIYEFRSVVRMTGHDFGYIGTGTRLPRNVGGSGEVVRENETKTLDFGQVFWNATDELGNFTVGEFFRVDQSTGRVSFSTDQFDLTGLSELGPFRDDLDRSVGTVIREISDDVELNSERDGGGESPGSNTIPTQTAVKSYVDERVGAVVDVEVVFPSSDKAVISGVSFGSLYAIKGLTYRFILEGEEGVVPDEFWIVDENNDPLKEEDGVTNNGAQLSTVLYTVPLSQEKEVYYRLGDRSIQGKDEGDSTLFITNPDIVFPSGKKGSVQLKGEDEEGNPKFTTAEDLKVVGSTLEGSFSGVFSGDGQFLENLRLRQEMNDITDVDLGVNQKEEDDIIAYFSGTEEDDRQDFRLAKAYLPVEQTDGTMIEIPIKYNYKEGTPRTDFTPGKLDFSVEKASGYVSVI